ncbi:hypothetical protein Vretimale_9185 [Volvox reticuliferus]|uniref:Uncharacterized protein n=1 Tax=Volvox reticuliferus TaxID=1737510 RepID=A0A8J4CFA9_9CHLO|nr:hypothetical protein Vretifemale_9984 [Volvox reticuliferus]GIM04687.1 hypothetical protein Vretimale_9185 [Volvox reticuliferus]
MDSIIRGLGLDEQIYQLFTNADYGISGEANVTWCVKPGLFALRIDMSYTSEGLDPSLGVPDPTDGNLGVIFTDTGSGSLTRTIISNGNMYTDPPPIPPPPPPPSPPPPIDCISAYSCLPKSFTNISQLLQDPFTLVGGGSIDTGSEKIFTDLPISHLVEIPTLLAAGGRVCPFVSLTGAQITQLGKGEVVDGLQPDQLGGVPLACASMARWLTPSSPYILGFAAVADLPLPGIFNADEYDVSKTNKAICAALNPCMGTYIFGFDAPIGRQLRVSQDPMFSGNLNAFSLVISSNPGQIKMNLRHLWDPTVNRSKGGAFTDVKQFNGKMMVYSSPLEEEEGGGGGFPSFSLQARGTGALIAAFNFTHPREDLFQLAWSPLQVDSSGTNSGGISMAIYATGRPNISFLSGKSSLRLWTSQALVSGLWTTHANGSYVLQLSATTFQPFGNITILSMGIESLSNLFSDYPSSGSTSFAWYIRPGLIALRLDVTFDAGDNVSLKPSLGVPDPTDGNLGIILSDTGSGSFAISVVSNGKIYNVNA